MLAFTKLLSSPLPLGVWVEAAMLKRLRHLPCPRARKAKGKVPAGCLPLGVGPWLWGPPGQHRALSPALRPLGPLGRVTSLSPALPPSGDTLLSQSPLLRIGCSRSASPVLNRRRKCEERGGAQEATGATPPSPVLAGPPKSTSHFLTCRSVSGMPPRGPRPQTPSWLAHHLP